MLLTDVSNGVATMTLARPPVNAISEEWVSQFNSILETLEDRDDWTVLLVRSNLNVFCAGADLAEMRERMAMADCSERSVAFTKALQDAFGRIERLSRPSIAEIGGAAMGGGFELALACDFRIASLEAKLGLPEVRLGLIPGAGGTQRLTRLCGRPVATRVILGAEIVNGETALALGLVHWAVPAVELADCARDIAERISAMPGPALAAAKTCIALAGAGEGEGYRYELEATGNLIDMPETRERVAQFLARDSKSRARSKKEKRHEAR